MTSKPKPPPLPSRAPDFCRTCLHPIVKEQGQPPICDLCRNQLQKLKPADSMRISIELSQAWATQRLTAAIEAALKETMRGIRSCAP